MIWRLLILATLMGCSAPTPPTDNGEHANPAPKPRLDFRELVQGLASPNKPIRITNAPDTIAIPPNYDWNAQARIEENRQLLFDHCDEALPFLIEASADPRYSMVSHWSEDTDYARWSVGRVCSEIIQRHVEVFRHHMQFTMMRWHKYNFVPVYRSTSAREADEIKAWWRERKGLSLRELQLAGFDWAIAKRKREYEVEPEDQRASREIKDLISTRETLSRSHEALTNGMMWQSLLSPPKGYKVVLWMKSDE